MQHRKKQKILSGLDENSGVHSSLDRRIVRTRGGRVEGSRHTKPSEFSATVLAYGKAIKIHTGVIFLFFPTSGDSGL